MVFFSFLRSHIVRFGRVSPFFSFFIVMKAFGKVSFLIAATFLHKAIDALEDYLNNLCYKSSIIIFILFWLE